MNRSLYRSVAAGLREAGCDWSVSELAVLLIWAGAEALELPRRPVWLYERDLELFDEGECADGAEASESAQLRSPQARAAERQQRLELLYEAVKPVLALIPPEEWRERPELCGWLYQYMLEEEKAEAFASFKRGGKATAEALPAVTQLFTPEWIARYLAENAVGRVALERGLLAEPLEAWKWFDREAAWSTGAGAEQAHRAASSPIRVLDPACGCGHVLAVAFDTLLAAELAGGALPGPAVRQILSGQLVGLDIDPAAAALCRFVLLARGLRATGDLSLADEEPELRVYALQGPQQVLGSLLRVEQTPGSDGGELAGRGWAHLAERYDAVLTNPPYLSRRHMSPELCSYLDRNYSEGRQDLFAAFLLRCLELCRPGGYAASVHQHAWMFLEGYEPLRERFLDESELLSLVHLGKRAFPDVGGEKVQTVCLLHRNGAPAPEAAPVIWDLTEARNASDKESAYRRRDPACLISVRQDTLRTLPGRRFAYRLAAAWGEAFRTLPPLSRWFAAKKGIDTGDNARFVRAWHEVPAAQRSRAAGGTGSADGPWRPYAKGGGSRRWYGNHYYVVDWTDDGRLIRSAPGSSMRNAQYAGQPGLTWSTVSAGNPGFRLLEEGFCFDNGGACLFPLPTTDPDARYSLLAYLNSSSVMELLQALSPTLNVQPGDIGRIPADAELLRDPELRRLGRACVELAEREWNEQECSWHYREHPLIPWLRSVPDPAEAYRLWAEERAQLSGMLRLHEQEIDKRVAQRLGMACGEAARAAGSARLLEPVSPQEAAAGLLSHFVGWATGRYSPPSEGEPPAMIVPASFGPGVNLPNPAAPKVSHPPLSALHGLDCRREGTLMRQLEAWHDVWILSGAQVSSASEAIPYGLAQSAEMRQPTSDCDSLCKFAARTAFPWERLRQWLAQSLGLRRGETATERLHRFLLDEYYDWHLSVYQKRPAYRRLVPDNAEADGYYTLVPVAEPDSSAAPVASAPVQLQLF